jgi:hypothetical protein
MRFSSVVVYSGRDFFYVRNDYFKNFEVKNLSRVSINLC